MDDLIKKANILIRKDRPYDNNSKTPITVFKCGDFLQLTFISGGCRNSLAGTCSMCNYGIGYIVNIEKTICQLRSILSQEYMSNINTILLGSSGSFLDNSELIESLQYSILTEIAKSKAKNIIIETHYASITENKLKKISLILSDKHIEIEMGLETTNKEFQEKILNKRILLSRMSNLILLIHKYNMTVTLNVLLGIPFLSPSQQIADTHESIKWALRNNADYIIGFPLNIQPYTLFEWFYKRDLIKKISPWLMVILINKLSDTELNHFSISWYGNREIIYDYNHKTLPPYSCNMCNNDLLQFFDTFVSNRDIKNRRTNIERLMSYPYKCNCRDKIIKDLEDISNNKYEYSKAYLLLKEWVNSHEHT